MFLEFKSLPQLINHFHYEKVCWDYLEKQLWDGKPVCPHCGATNERFLRPVFLSFQHPQNDRATTF